MNWICVLIASSVCALANFRLVNRELVSLPRDAWQLVVDQGSFAQSNIAPAIAGAIFAGENHHDSIKRSLLDNIRTFFKNNPTWK
jgi:uncharacterized protein YuzB (UPF0349 family)